MSSSHPLFNVDYILNLTLRLLNLFRDRFITRLWFSRTFQVTSKVLQECNFFLKIFWIVKYIMFLADILSISGPSLYVIKVVVIWIKNNLRRIVKENSHGLVAQVVA